MPEPEPQPELEPELKLSQGHIAATKRIALASQSDCSDQKATHEKLEFSQRRVASAHQVAERSRRIATAGIQTAYTS